MSKFQNFPNCKIIWNFFASNHGHNSCDMAASQIKRKLKQQINCTREELNINKNIAFSNEIDHHKASVIDFENEKLKTRTMIGISSYHQFKFAANKVEVPLVFDDNHGLEEVITKKKECKSSKKNILGYSRHSTSSPIILCSL